ncbi:hypothetical protein TNCT_18492 [Trichonephila clavata]|uniref:Uncharacterized protein n=1 Tax=Trichonephila clavata TaxID=2740835 RepID=A0A8X6GRK4_TRICU|nr:hypothetical protein TNCT_18492 [Trichonephila clavata]
MGLKRQIKELYRSMENTKDMQRKKKTAPHPENSAMEAEVFEITGVHLDLEGALQDEEGQKIYTVIREPILLVLTNESVPLIGKGSRTLLQSKFNLPPDAWKDGFWKHLVQMVKLLRKVYRKGLILLQRGI